MCIRLFLFGTFYTLYAHVLSLSFGIIISMTFMHTFLLFDTQPFSSCILRQTKGIYSFLSPVFLAHFGFCLPLSSLIQAWLLYISSLTAAFVNKLHIPSVMSSISDWLILSVFLATFAYDHKLPLLLPRQFQLNNHVQLLVSKQV